MDTILIYVTAISTLIAGLVAYWVFVAGRKVFVSPTNWFLCLQVPFLVGTLQAIDVARREDLLWLFVVIAGTLCFILGAHVANCRKDFRPGQEIPRFTSLPMKFDLQQLPYSVLVLGIGIVCVAVGIIFMMSIETNVFLWAISNFWSSGEISQGQYGMMRTAITTGREGYVAPGYTLQFVGILLPMILFLLYFRVRETRRTFEIVLLVVFLLGDLYFITAFGTRGGIIFLSLAFVLLVSPFGPIPSVWRSVRKTTYIVLVSLLAFYAVSTFLMGRVRTNLTDGSWAQMLGGTIFDLYDRTTGAYASEMLTLVRHLMTQPVGWGAEWWQSLVSIAPGGVKGYGFSNEMSLFLYGAIEGNAGLNVYASLCHNLGVWGSLAAFFVIGFLIQNFTIHYVRGERSLIRVVVLFVAGFRLGMFRDPYSLFLEGFVTVMIYYALMLFLKERRLGTRRQARQARPNEERLLLRTR